MVDGLGTPYAAIPSGCCPVREPDLFYPVFYSELTHLNLFVSDWKAADVPF